MNNEQWEEEEYQKQSQHAAKANRAFSYHGKLYVCIISKGET